LSARLWAQVHGRPVLLAALALGVGVAWGLHWLWPGHGVTCALLGWTLGALSYMLGATALVQKDDPAQSVARAQRLDGGQGAVLLMSVLAAAASMAAIGAELLRAKSLSGTDRLLHLGLAGFTIAISWAFIHFVFALHYAHEYHLGTHRRGEGGLDFPGDDAPDFIDFLYLSYVIGTSAQTADVSLTSRRMRRLGLLHCVLAFVFNATVLALTINLTASLW
jgi:uncharacterized membrane protein